MRELCKLPVGWVQFHHDAVFNFQLNRWYSAGLARREDFLDVAQKIKDFSDWRRVMTKLAKIAEFEGRLVNAATYYRAAEFFVPPTDSRKQQLYDKCITLFDSAFQDEPLEKFEIPYEGGLLSCLRVLPTTAKRGTILVHGGYDSFNEEFYLPMAQAAKQGWEIVLFEGPGQGKTLHKHKLVMTHEWEKPTSTVIDHLDLTDVTLIGISLGGYLAMRAAACDQRIRRVVAFDIIWDFYQAMMRPKPLVSRVIVNTLVRIGARSKINAMERKIRASSLFADWLLSQGYMVFGVNNLFDYLKTLKLYSTREISKQIKGDVLLLAGEDDLYTPFLANQRKALVNAKSVEERVFTREEEASHHCQVGNLPLVIDFILDWVRRKER